MHFLEKGIGTLNSDHFEILQDRHQDAHIQIRRVE